MTSSLSGRVRDTIGTCTKRETEMECSEEEFVSLVYENIPNWTSIWNALLTGNRGLRKRSYERENVSVLQKKIRMKINELLNEEETLVDLYNTAAETAKKNEEEFREKSETLIKQIEKHKNLIETFKLPNV